MTHKLGVAAVEGLYGHADPTPAESTWTHLLMNIQQTVLRKGAYSVDPDCWQPAARPEPAALDPDNEAFSTFFTEINGVKSRKVKQYYDDPRTLSELTVYAVSMEVVDRHLLYPILGDSTKFEEAGEKGRFRFPRPRR